MSEENQKETAMKREIDKVMVQKLSEGLVSMYNPTLKSVKNQLIEIVKKQEFLCEQLQDENLKLSQSINSVELQEMFEKVKLYKEKLCNIKQVMMALHKQSINLKKRALKLEQKKQREALDRVHQREYEELLIRKHSTL